MNDNEGGECECRATSEAFTTTGIRASGKVSINKG